MSVWTHVAGIVRLDCIRVMYETEMIPKAIQEYFGKELRWDDDDDAWKENYEHKDRFLPCGSEGSLRMSIWENPNESHVSAYTVSIFGDLRDFDDAQSIIDWFKSKLDEESMSKAIPCWVRQASIVVRCEIGETLEYHC